MRREDRKGMDERERVREKEGGRPREKFERKREGGGETRGRTEVEVRKEKGRRRGIKGEG